MKNNQQSGTIWFVLGGLCLVGGFIYGGAIIVLLGALLLSVGFRKNRKNNSEESTSNK